MQNQEYPNFPTETTNHMNESQDSYLSNVAIIIPASVGNCFKSEKEKLLHQQRALQTKAATPVCTKNLAEKFATAFLP